jgi:membrane fusion protein (multidrug efflux system)
MNARRLTIGFFCIGALAAQTVDVVQVIAKKSGRKVELPGEFHPYQSVAVRAKVTGFVKQVLVDRGSMVNQGELLATVLAPELTAQRAEAEAKALASESQRVEAEAKVVAAESTYNKLKSAAQTPGVVAGNDVILAQKAVDASTAQVQALGEAAKAARAAADALRDMESYLKVTAPFAGVITERHIHPGALVGPGANSPEMFQLEQNFRLRLVVAVPEVDVAGIAPGARITFTVPAYPGERFSGPVARIAHSMDAKTRSMAVELDVANRGIRLSPGMYPTVEWYVRRPKPTLFVPVTSVVTTTERTFVIRVREGIAEWVNVSRGRTDGEQVEIYGPLEAGDVVVRNATDELHEGARVNGRPAAKPS